MSPFALDPAAVANTSQKLRETGQIVNTEAVRAQSSTEGAKGFLAGAAYNAAYIKQGEFADCVARLHREIDEISEALDIARSGVEAEDELNESEFMAIVPAYARLA